MEVAILASQNRNKIKEISSILNKYGLEVVSRDDAGLPTDDVEETGLTFEENSYLKADYIARIIRSDCKYKKYIHSPIIADDSGLRVDALGGEPGVYSARYAGEGCTYEDNNRKLLKALEGIKEKDRTARFITVITLLYPEGLKINPFAVGQEYQNMLVARGEVKGYITTEKRGSHGFGYDPIFIPEGWNKTFAEFGAEEKNAISHRAKALKKLEELLAGKQYAVKVK
ncbi:MAG TPA: RdgB/HAM1 family non-canonical purine NTP pyrophosphatase [Mogibacterium sp.]|nr:RdgB/HAM1 family non-canonical purine NTP pyrophosphatase [Mogibacterium sp.]